MNKINKKFGRSGGFKKKKSKLVKEIVSRCPMPNVFGGNSELGVRIDNVWKQTGIDAIACDNDQFAPESLNILQYGDVDRSFGEDPTINEALIPCDERIISDAESEIEMNIPYDENLDENKEIARDYPFNKIKFQSLLRTWAVNNGIKHDQLRGLLKIWNEYVPLPPLPIDPRTILATPRRVIIKENKYWYRGLKSALQKMMENCTDIPDDLSLKFNMDGITISKSSGIECWPILVEFAGLEKISPEIIGVYCGQGKPKDLELYLRDFVNELNECMSNGIIRNERKLNIKLECFIADSPARALLKSEFFFSTLQFK